MKPLTPSTHNRAFLALFTLPPIKESSGTELTVPATPAPTIVTGDRELDAVLWLRECIGTAHSALIEKALEAFKKIKTPAKDLEKRYGDYLMRVSGGCAFSAALGSISFANLEALAKRVTERQARKHEAMSRFGSVEALFENTPSEAACRAALKGLRKKKDALWGYEAEKADARFLNWPELVPASLSDCLVALDYERQLYWLRCASVENAGDHWPEFQEHADFCFRQLALIAPASKGEALAVFEHLVQNDEMGRAGTPDIMRNLIAAGQASRATIQQSLNVELPEPEIDLPCAGAKALDEYLEWCREHAIVPDVGGAFAYAIRAGAEIAAATSVPQGWKLVPVEPTREMLDHVNRTVPDLFELGDEYRAMLAAAPQLPKKQDPACEESS